MLLTTGAWLHGGGCQIPNRQEALAAHPNARLSVFGRQLLVATVTVLGWLACVARQLGVSRATAYKSLRRYGAEGQAELPRSLQPAAAITTPAAGPAGRHSARPHSPPLRPALPRAAGRSPTVDDLSRAASRRHEPPAPRRRADRDRGTGAL